MRTFATIAAVLISGCTIGPALFVERTGEGAGEVTTDPEELHCGEDCAMIVESDSITLIAAPSRGSRFAGWSGGGCAGTDPCTLSIAVDTTVVAAFDPALQPLLVTRSGHGAGRVISEPGGIECGQTCTASFREGTTVTLSATADAGSFFVGWTGACSGRDACTIPVELAATVDAEFVPLQTLTVQHAGEGGGRITSSTAALDCMLAAGSGTCSTSVLESSTVALTATPSPGSTFVGWTGGICVGAGPCVVTVIAPVTVVAVFARACTSTVTASEPAATFNTRLTSHGALVCLADGVRISGPVVIGAGAITIKSLPGGMGTIENLNGTAISLGGRGVSLLGVHVHSDGPQLSSAIDAGIGGGVVLRDSHVRCSGHNCYLVRLPSGGSATIERSTLASDSTYSFGVDGYSRAQVTIRNSTVDSSGSALNVTVGSTFTVADSTLIGRSSYTGGINGNLTVWHDARLTLSGSTVITNGFRAIRAGGSVGVSIRLDGNTFRQMAGLPAESRSPIISEGTDNVFESTTPNTFCNEGTATDDAELALPLISGEHSAAGTFDAVHQVAPGDCQ